MTLKISLENQTRLISCAAETDASTKDSSCLVRFCTSELTTTRSWHRLMLWSKSTKLLMTLQERQMSPESGKQFVSHAYVPKNLEWPVFVVNRSSSCLITLKNSSNTMNASVTGRNLLVYSRLVFLSSAPTTVLSLIWEFFSPNTNLTDSWTTSEVTPIASSSPS